MCLGFDTASSLWRTDELIHGVKGNGWDDGDCSVPCEMTDAETNG